MGFKKRFQTVLLQDDRSTGTGVALPFDPREAFGAARAPVRVTINRHTFRTTTATMKGLHLIPVNRENREAAGIAARATITVEIEPDTEPRIITAPADLRAALRANRAAAAAWDRLSYTHRKEHVRALEEAVKPETRARRLASAIEMLARR